MIKPNLNVTPLIDILLVLLIIFMVISPLKPSSFKAKIPAEPKDEPTPVSPNPFTLVVNINSDSTVSINNKNGFGDSENTAKLTEELQSVFADRQANGALALDENSAKENGAGDGIERTVFIKAPKEFGYGKVVKVIDAVKLSGAGPIGLQIDQLSN